MSPTLVVRSALVLSGLLASAVRPVLSQAGADGTCAAAKACTEVREFAATVTSFRSSSVDQATKAIAVTVRFQNKGAQPVVLGYVAESGVITDDKGNRYLVSGPNGVRGIGTIAGTEIDPKFTVEPGEASDARFEFVLKLGSPDQALGSVYEMDLAVRQIERAEGDRWRLGKEHALHLAGLGPSAVAAEPEDPCGGKPRCFAAGPFTAEVTRVTPTQGGRHHLVTFNIRIRNVSPEPIILGYRDGSSSTTDNYGNPYYWGRAGTYDGSAKGIGHVNGRQADPQFVLKPGQSREAQFTVIRFQARAPLGTVFTYSLALETLEILPPNGVRTLEQYAVSFSDLSATLAGSDVVQGAKKLLDALKKPN
jgi:hypothetical protein